MFRVFASYHNCFQNVENEERLHGRKRSKFILAQLLIEFTASCNKLHITSEHLHKIPMASDLIDWISRLDAALWFAML